MARRFKILITGMFLPHTEREVAELADIADVVVDLTPSRPRLLELVGDADALLLDVTPIDEELLEHAPRLKAIVVYGVGTDHIDLKAAAARGVVVSNSPEAFATDVAEHAIALLLGLSRRVALAAEDVRHRQLWETYGDTYKPVRLRGKTLGLVGIGRIGQEAGRIAAGIGMKLLAFDPFVDFARLELPSHWDLGSCDTLAELLGRADAVSLHLPLTPESRRLIGRTELQQMKPGAFLVNVSRGGLVDLEALRAALDSGRLAGAALDVFDPEPPDWDDPLLQSRNLVLTPHIGWKSEVSVLQVELDTVAEVCRILLGQAPKFQVNG